MILANHQVCCMSFLSIEAEQRVGKSSLVTIGRSLRWERIVAKLGSLGRSGLGPNGYDITSLLKALVLQAWHSLSDAELEDALRLRMDFMLFSGFSGDVPDETTICRFRNLLVAHGGQEKLLKEVNRQLRWLKLQVKPSKGAVLDATIIESASRPHDKEYDAEVIDRKEDEAVVSIVSEKASTSADKDAAWLKKGKKSYYGYKAFVVTDSDEGYIERVHTTPANVSEMTEMENALGDLTPNRLYADKGSASKANRDSLRSRKIKSALMHKAQRNKPLTGRQKLFNKLVSKRRYIVEQCFGTLKRRFHCARASYNGLVKVNAWMHIKAVAFNLLKAANKILKATAIAPPMTALP
jgi:IS5 family transposase